MPIIWIHNFQFSYADRSVDNIVLYFVHNTLFVFLLSFLYSEYDNSLLQKKLSVINSELLEYTGTAFELHVTLKEPQTVENNEKKADIPPQVRLLVDIFKGSLVGR